MLRFLQQYPSARLVRGSKLKAIAKALKGPYVGDKLTFSAQDILRAAQSSVAVVSPVKEIIVRGKIAALFHLQERLEEVTKLLTDLCEATRLEDLKILESIKGVGPKTAVPFLAEMGEVKNFTSHKKLIAFAGLDPSVHQSGKFVGASKLSKRGNRHLRRAVYLMTASVVSQNSLFKAYFLRRRWRNYLLRIPTQIGHPFRSKPTTYSVPIRPVIPKQTGHPLTKVSDAG
jgi:transposase